MTARYTAMLNAVERAIKGKATFDEMQQINAEIGRSELLFLQELVTLGEELTLEQQLRLTDATKRYFLDGVENASSR